MVEDVIVVKSMASLKVTTTVRLTATPVALFAGLVSVTVGAVAADYVRDGQLQFLLGWLLPHGVIEIPAILLGGQAGFVLATALVGFGARESRRQRLAAVRPDVASLAGGVAVMLVWAGVMESFISQYHNPVLPYPLKIGLGVVELCLLVVWLGRGGRKP